MNGELAAIFMKLVNMSISAGWVCLAVVLLRLLLQKAPKWSRLMLWAIVGLRLVLPFSMESVLSLLPSGETIDTNRYVSRPYVHSGIAPIDRAANHALGERYFEGVTVPPAEAPTNPMHILAILWLIGMAAMFAYMLISYIRIRQKMQTATKIQENVYESELVETPFVLGTLQPRIYLPYAVREADRRYILAHETAHIRHYDHLMKPFAFALLTVYWFQPLIWLAFILFCRDLEFACDERVIRTLNVTDRANYSQALLACSLPQKKISVCPLAFSENDTKNRIRSVLQYQKPAFWVVLLALVLCIAAAVCLLSDPKTDGKQTRSGEVILAEADADGDGAEETLSYQKLGDESDGPAYLLHITKSDGTELWPEEEYLSESHVGWVAYFLYRDDEGYAILDYSPWAGQGFASYSYKLYRFEGSNRKIAQEGSVDFAMPKNAEETWPPEAVAFADEVNALLDHSTLLISTIGGQLRTGEDADLWKCGPEKAGF